MKKLLPTSYIGLSLSGGSALSEAENAVQKFIQLKRRRRVRKSAAVAILLHSEKINEA